MTFARGQVLARRYFKRHINTWTQAVVTVADDAAGLLLWSPVGAEFVMYRDAAGRSIRDIPVDRLDGAHVHTTWAHADALLLHPPGAAYSVWWFFRDGAFDGWYVNLEDPYARWADGIDTMDHALDLVVAADRTLAWKDEDEFAERTGHPWYWDEAQAAGIRATGDRLAALAASGAYPFDGTHTDFRPDPGWERPVLPAGWGRPRAYR